MNGLYTNSPYLWAIALSAAILLGLAVYGWLHRTISGAIPFTLAMVCGFLVCIGAGLELASVGLDAKVFWIKYQTLWILPGATAVLCFALDYAGLGAWVTRRRLAFLLLPSVVLVLGLVTSNSHELMWRSFGLAGEGVRQETGPLLRILVAYGFLLSLATLGVLIWLFIRSPFHRWPAALIICGVLATRAAYIYDLFQLYPRTPFDMALPAFVFSAGMYAVALFRFRLFDPIPVARETVVQQMRDGMLVIDTRGKVVGVNRSMEAVLQERGARLHGRQLADVLPDLSALHPALNGGEYPAVETEVGVGAEARQFVVSVSPLRDRKGTTKGSLVLLHDVTEERRAHAQILEQQRALAALQERERLARELHDSAGQILGYVSMQAQAISKRMSDGNIEAAQAQLARLADAAREAHVDLRESILSLKSASAESWAFFTALTQYLDAFGRNYGINTELVVSDGLIEDDFAPETAVQLLRVIQEALANARKHGQAGCVQILMDRSHTDARIVVTDDGEGFNPDQPIHDGKDHLGLAYMRERMSDVGGSVTITSWPGSGTRVTFLVPARAIREEKAYESIAG